MKATEKQKEYMREYYQRTKDEKKPSLREYHHVHKEQIGKRRKLYRAKHLARIREREKQSYANHRAERKKSYRARWGDDAYRLRKLYLIRRRSRGIKVEVFSHYGRDGKPCCVHCGLEDIEVLCMDHINNDGAKRRRELGIIGGLPLYRWLQRNSYPEGYQVLCANCNLKKQIQRFGELIEPEKR